MPIRKSNTGIGRHAEGWQSPSNSLPIETMSGSFFERLARVGRDRDKT